MTTENGSLKPVGRYISGKELETYDQNYMTQRWVYVKERTGLNDSRSSWFTLDELEAFFQNVRAQGGDGIRLFFGVYDANAPEYPGQQTIALVATQSTPTKGGIVHKLMQVATANGEDILGYNCGRLCPPDCEPQIMNDEGEAEAQKPA
jgi:hypothetical protein